MGTLCTQRPGATHRRGNGRTGTVPTHPSIPELTMQQEGWEQVSKQKAAHTGHLGAPPGLAVVRLCPPPSARAGHSGTGRPRLLSRSPRRAPARPGLRQQRAPSPAGAARDCGARAPSPPSGPCPRGTPNRSPASPRPAPAPWLPAPVPRPAPAAACTAQRYSGRCCRRGRLSSYLQSAAGGSEAGPGRGGVSGRPRLKSRPFSPLP
jgi:hypothetical protein